MKKKIRMLLALLLCAVLLAGCGAPAMNVGMSPLLVGVSEAEDEEEGEIPRFRDMVYERPQGALDDIERNMKKLEKALDEDISFRTVTYLLDLCYADYYHFDTMYCLVEIRSCLDMTDEFYAEELSWCDDAYYDLQDLMEEIYYLCGASAMAERLEQEYFWEGFAGEYADATLSTYNEETLTLMHRESSLLAAYRELTASPTITLRGQEIDLYSYLADADSLSYDAALRAYYRQYNGEMSRIYIELVKTRKALAEALGFASYEEMAYAYSFDRDYTPEQAERYIEEVRQLIVPLYEQLNPYAVDYAWLEEEDLFNVIAAGARAMGGDVREAFEFMNRYELYDVSLSADKAGKSFQSYLSQGR